MKSSKNILGDIMNPENSSVLGMVSNLFQTVGLGVKTQNKVRKAY